MPLIPLEDTFSDLIAKAQRGYGLSDEKLIAAAEITAEDLAALRVGEARLGPLRRVARHLHLSPYALENLAVKPAYPKVPVFPRGLAFFNTPVGDMTVNNYLVWDEKTREAAVIDTGADCEDLLATVETRRLRVRHILLTHAHHDHVAALPRLVAATGADVWADRREKVPFEGVRVFDPGAYFHLGEVAIKCLDTSGHSPGQTTFYVQGLAWPLALCGDAMFSCSVGGSPTHFREQVKNTRARIFSLPKDTVIGPGHGPMTTLAHERVHNPVFAPARRPEPPTPSRPAEAASAPCPAKRFSRSAARRAGQPTSSQGKG